jgi:hypothetical protein
MSDFFGGKQGRGAPVDLERLLDVSFIEHLRVLVSQGALVSVGTTRDGGCLSATVTVDGEWNRQYFRDSEDLLSWMVEAQQAIADLPPPKPAPPERGSRRRRT